MKAEMGSMRKALLEAGISFERSPKLTTPRDQVLNGKQITKFAGVVEKNKADKVSQRSLVPVQPREQVSDSEGDNQPEYGNKMMAIKPTKHVSPRTINAMMVGITRRKTEFQVISECDASVDRALDDKKIDGPMSFNWSMQGDLFGEKHVHKALESRDVMDPQGDAREDQLAEDSTSELEACSNDSASDKDGDECEAVESECSIVDETVRPSLMKMRTRSKARPNIVVPDSLMCSDPEDDEPPPRRAGTRFNN